MSKRKFEEINAEQTTNSEKSMAASNSSSSLELSNDQDEESIDVQEPDSTPSFSLQKTRTNFCRLCQLFVTICGDVFRAILSYHIKPINLRTELDNNKTKIEKVLNMEQRNILYPATGGHNISSRELDLSLVYILLRNICNIPSHQKGWGKEPESSDNSLAARIDRLRIKRNSIAHHKNGQIEDNEFEFIWDVIRSNVIEIEKLYLGTSTFEWIIDDLYSRDIDPLKANKYVKEFRLLEDRLIEVEGKMSTVSEELVVKQETMGVHSECITQLGHNRAVDKAQMDHLSSDVRDLKAQIDRIEAHQSSDAKDIKGTLKGVRGRIDDIEEWQSIDTKDTKDKLTRMGKNITDMTERWNHIEEFLLQTNRGRVKSFSPLFLKSTIRVPNLTSIYHISAVTPDALWVSGEKLKGHTTQLQQVNAKGDVIKTLPDEYRYKSCVGGHSVTLDGDILFRASTDSSTKVSAYKMTSDGSISLFYTPDDDSNIDCLHCSHITGDILIVIWKSFNSSIVLRCDSIGRMTQEIEFKDPEQTERLYGDPQYITENRINGDIIVSDASKGALVVVDRSGRHRFDYIGHLSSSRDFTPGAVCTDIIGRILLFQISYKEHRNSVSLLDQDGNFIMEILKEKKDISYLLSPNNGLWVDDKYNIYIAQEKEIRLFR